MDVIIQARMGSSRLPGKVLKKIDGITILECVINQLKFCKKLDRIIIATTSNLEDDKIVDLLQEKNVGIFRGSETDVLDRYYQCAKKFQSKDIVRITSDNPLIDPEIVDKIISIYKNTKYEYVNNFMKKTFPIGIHIEVFSYESLEKAWKQSKEEYDREHVTPFIYNNPKKFLIFNVENEEDLSKISLTVDTISDFKRIEEIYSEIKKRPILLRDILEILKKK